MITQMKKTAPLLAIILAGACSAEPAPQVVSGRAELSTFPSGVTEVQALSQGRVVAGAALGSDGSFALTVPAEERYRLVFVSPSSRTTLVYPRRDGSLDTTFYVHRGATTLNIGDVRYVGDATGITYSYGPDCVDATDVMCVEEADGDNNQEGDDEADGDNNQEGVDEADGDNNQCGVDEPDGDNNQEGVDEAAVAEYILPASIGCDEDEGGDDDGGDEDVDEEVIE